MVRLSGMRAARERILGSVDDARAASDRSSIQAFPRRVRGKGPCELPGPIADERK